MIECGRSLGFLNKTIQFLGIFAEFLIEEFGWLP